MQQFNLDIGERLADIELHFWWHNTIFQTDKRGSINFERQKFNFPERSKSDPDTINNFDHLIETVWT